MDFQEQLLCDLGRTSDVNDNCASRASFADETSGENKM